MTRRNAIASAACSVRLCYRVAGQADALDASVEVQCLLGCDAVSLGEQLPTFRRNVMLSSSVSKSLRIFGQLDPER